MRKLLLAAAGVAALVAACPASAQTVLSGQLSYGGSNPSWYRSYGYSPGYGYGPGYGYSYGYGSYGYGPPGSPFGRYGYSNTPFGPGYANGAYAWGSRPTANWYGSYGGPYAYGGADAYAGYYAYGADCLRVRQRIVTSSGRVIYRMREAC
jgi:hypothetical protein